MSSSALEEMLGADETVEAMAQARYQGCFGLAVLTDTHLLFLSDGVIWKVSDDIALDRIGLVQWQAVFGFGTLTVHSAGAPLQFTGIIGPGGKAVLRGLRAHLSEKDRLKREARNGVLALTAYFAPAAIPEAHEDEEPLTPLFASAPAVATDPEFAAHI